MKRIDLLYTNLLSLLSNLTIDGPSFSTFHEQIADEGLQELLISISDNISRERREIAKCQLAKVFCTDYSNLIDYINEFNKCFNSFPGFRKDELYAIITVLEKLTSEFSGSKIDLEEEIDVDAFEILPVSEALNQNNYFHFDTDNIFNSLLLFNVHEKEAFEKFISSVEEGSDIFFYLLYGLGKDNNVLDRNKYVLIRRGFSDKPKKVWSALCLHILSVGKIIHYSHDYNKSPMITSDCKIELGKDYHQFSDSLYIASEYNNQKDILDKYLRIYHVIENFMFKRPIVSLEKDSGGNPFSIRDFKRMYDRVSASELALLKKLSEVILQLDYSGTDKFEKKVLDDWAQLVSLHGADENKINSLLKILNIYNSSSNEYLYNGIDEENLSSFFSKLIYGFRNSIVHNRETEFHLTHLTLNNHFLVGNTAKIILESFLLPILEEIVFNLIIKKNDIVWYTNSSLKLWEEE